MTKLQERFPEKLTPFEVALIALSALVFFGTSAIYFSGTTLRSLLSNWEDGSGEPLGRVKAAEKDLRRRLRAESVFREVDGGAPLYGRDTLITGPDSGAVLELDDGTEIKMGPSTLIRLSFEADIAIGGITRRALIDVLSGSASGASSPRSNRKVILRSAGKSAELSANRKPVEITARSATPVLAAAAPPKPPEPPQDIAQAPPSPVPTPEHEAQPTPIPTPKAKKAAVASKVTLLPAELEGKPLANGAYSGPFPRNPEITFRWKADPPAERYVLKLSNKTRPGSAVVELRSDSQSVKWSIPATYAREWTYALEAWPKSGRPVTSRSARLSLSFIGPEPRNPRDKAVIPAMKAPGKKNDIIFTWPRWPIAVGYVFEMASDPRMENVILKKERGEAENFVTTTELLPGAYYWTVKALAKDGSLSPPSTVRSLTIN